MEKLRLILIPIIALLSGIVIVTCGKADQARTADKLDKLYQKDEVVILITDSGLGGLSVMADVAGKLEKKHPFKKVHLVFANALADTNYLYNQMSTTEEKVNVFSSALTGMAGHFQPDLILIACNTLSVIYPLTEFARGTDIPVIDIVEFGAGMMADYLTANPHDAVVIMGTPTTIEQDSHRQRLLKAGIAPGRIITQPCDMLESEIQSDPEGDITHTMIDMYVSEAVGNLPVEFEGGLGIGLCCTHYGYSGGYFEKSFESLSGRESHVLNPNTVMSQSLFRPEYTRRHETTEVTAEVVSRVPLADDAISSISRMLETDSPLVAEALRHYELKPDLFVYSKKSRNSVVVPVETGNH